MRSTSGSRTCSIMSRMRFLPRARVEIGVGAQYLVDLAADRHHRIERGHRLLKDHRHGGGAQLPQAAVAGGEQFLADQLDAAAGRHQRALLQQAHHRQRGHGFARSAFADQAQRLALAHLQRDAVDDPRRLARPCRGRRRGFRCRGRCWSSHRFLPVIPGRSRSDRTRNLEIPGLVLTHHPGMTMLQRRSAPRNIVTCRPPAASCGDRARRGRRRRSG